MKVTMLKTAAGPSTLGKFLDVNGRVDTSADGTEKSTTVLLADGSYDVTAKLGKELVDTGAANLWEPAPKETTKVLA